MMASAGPSTYQDALRILLADAEIDAVIVVCTSTNAAPIADVAVALADVAAELWDKPLVANLVGFEGIPEPLRGERAVLPCFPFPETAAQALARAAWYGDWRRRPVGQFPSLDRIDLRAPRPIVAEFLAEQPDGGWLDPVAAAGILTAFGIPVTPLAFAASAAYDEMAAPGVETIAGMVRDPGFGPLVMFGLGGVAAELVGDTALKVAPLTDQDAAELVRSLRSSPLLFGYRGSAPVDTTALEDLLLRLSRLGEQVPELAELDLNPVIARPGSVVVVDWRMRLTPAGRRPSLDLRGLR